MADNLPQVRIERNTWTDIYAALAASGVNIGDVLFIENIGVCDVSLAVQATEPVKKHTAYNVIERGSPIRVANAQGSPGAWAYCNAADGLIQVSTIRHEGFTPVLDTRVPGGTGSGITATAWGTQKTSQDYSLFSGMFSFDVSPALWLVSENGVDVVANQSTRATSVDGYLNMTSGATAGDVTILESRRHPRYQPNRGLVFSASLGFKDASLDGILRAGLFVEDENGAYFKTKGDGNLYACIRSLGVETHEELINFPFAIDLTLGNIYDIQMQWRGVGEIRFYAGNPATGLLELVHRIEFLNTLDKALSVSNPALSASIKAENVTQEVTMWCGCVDVTAEGGRFVPRQYGSYDFGALSISTGDPILAIRSPALIGGKVNTRDVELFRITIASDKKVSVGVYRTRDPAAVTGGTYGPTITTSFLEANTTLTAVNLALLEKFSTFRVPAGGTIERGNPDLDTVEFDIVHGDIIVFYCLDGAIAAIDITVEWGDEI